LTDLRRPEPLDPARHGRTSFDSGEPALDEWLCRYAGRNRRRDIATTWGIATPDDRVVAYASLAMTAIDRAAAPRLLAKQAPDPVPALLLGRLAVDRRHAGLGIGTALVAHVLATAVELNTKAACRAIVVTAIHARARAWWERLGFHPFDPHDPADADLCLLASEIEATLRGREAPRTGARMHSSLSAWRARAYPGPSEATPARSAASPNDAQAVRAERGGVG
jgi:GNAT superfamily N-acetyltransferase